MNKLINTLKNNNFIALVLLGIVIQAITVYITYQTVPSHTDNLLFGNIGQPLTYLFTTQWIGYIIQLLISWKVTDSIKKAIAIFVITLPTMFIVFFVYFKVEHIKQDQKVAKSRIFSKSVDEYSYGSNAKQLTTEAAAKLPSKISVDSPSYELSCPSSFVIPEKFSTDFPEKYELLTLKFPIEFEKQGKYHLSIFYNSDLSVEDYQSVDGKTIVDVPSSGKYVVEWVIHSSQMWGYFVKSSNSHIKFNSAYIYTNNDIYPPDKLNQNNEFNKTDLAKEFPEQSLEIAGIANTLTKALPEHFECKKPETSIRLLKQ